MLLLYRGNLHTLMLVMTASKKNYSMIGRLLCRTFPDVASQLEDRIKPGDEVDFQKIFFFYSRFDSLDLPGYRDVHRRRLFAAVMLLFYYPHFLEVNNILQMGLSRDTTKPFAKNIAACFNCNKSHISRNVREAVVMYQAYEDFQEKVNEVLSFLKTESNGTQR